MKIINTVNILKRNKPICLQGETIFGTVISNPFKGVTTMQNSYIQFDILDRGNTAVIRVFGNRNTKNLDLASTFSIGQVITLQNPFLPQKDYHSADIWINEIKSYVFPFS